MNHLSTKGTKLVCRDCRTQGFRPTDLQTYTCQTCKGEFGAVKFNTQLLKHYKYNDNKKLKCMQCIAGEKDRERRLQKQLRQSKRRCISHCRIHQAKCPLTPIVFGEKRWPGSDGAITADDRNFLDQLNPCPAWWSKAWGR